MENKYKNKVAGGKLYKMKGDNKKIDKNDKNTNNIKKYVSSSDEDSESSSSSSINSNSESIQSTKKNNDNLRENSNKQLYFELIHKANEQYDKENNSDNDIERNINKNKNDNKENDNNKNIFRKKDRRMNTVDERKLNRNYKYLIKHQLNKYHDEETIDIPSKGTEKNGYGTITEIKKMANHQEFTNPEKNTKRRNRIKYKKAKIKKFKPLRDEDLDESTFKKSKKDNIFERLSGKSNNIFKFENSNKKLEHFSSKKEISNGNLKKASYKKVIHDNISDKENGNENYHHKKNVKSLYGINDNNNKKKKIKSSSQDNININYSRNINKTKNNQFNNLSSQTFTKRKINVIYNKNNKCNNQNYQNKSQYNLNRKLIFNGANMKKDHSTKNHPKHNHTKSVQLTEISKSKFNLMLGMDQIKSKFKKRLIEMDDKLIDAIHYYNGPIDISCISSKNYVETVKELNKKFYKNGFKCIKCEDNYFKFNNGTDSFLVEIVKIRNNMLYYLLEKIK